MGITNQTGRMIRPGASVQCHIRRPNCLRSGKGIPSCLHQVPQRNLRTQIHPLRRPQKKNKTTCFIVIHGETGCGTSIFAARVSEELSPYSTYYKPRGEWWDGYEQHKLIIVDDFYGWLKYDELLKITDRYPYRVPVKGGFNLMQLASTSPPTLSKMTGTSLTSIMEAVHSREGSPFPGWNWRGEEYIQSQRLGWYNV